MSTSPPGVRLERPIVLRWPAGRAGPRAHHPHDRDRSVTGASASIVEELVAADRGHRVRRGRDRPAGPLRRHDRGHRSAPARRSRSRAIQDCRTGPGRLPASPRRHRRGRDAPLGARPARRPPRPQSRVDNRLEGDRSSVEQVEIVFGGDEQLFDLTSYTPPHRPRHDRQPAVEGRAPGRRPELMKGLITIEKSAVGHGQLLGEFGMNLSKAARSVAIPSLEIDQPDCRRAAHASSVGPIDETQLFYLESRGHPARRGAQVHRPRLPRAGRRARPARRRRRTGCASCSRPSGRPGSRQRRQGRRGGATPMRRIDLLGVDEVADGEMKMVFVDGTDQVLVIHTGRRDHAPSRASAPTSTSSSTRAS